jgi:hypothetical protein
MNINLKEPQQPAPVMFEDQGECLDDIVVKPDEPGHLDSETSAPENRINQTTTTTNDTYLCPIPT